MSTDPQAPLIPTSQGPQPTLHKLKNNLTSLVNHVKTHDYAATGHQVTTYAKEHPYKTALHGTSLLLLAAPGILAAPVLGAAGFGAGGVVAGSAAAAQQATMGGTVAAGSVFAALQSAGAGGYGVAIVNGVVQGGAAAVGVGNMVSGWFWKGKKEEKEGKGVEKVEEDAGSAEGKEGMIEEEGVEDDGGAALDEGKEEEGASKIRGKL
ncbi:MAG: hypothetical protein Q9219_003228 [cf. Caloplaca sp. 3 TL-2023]